MEEKKGRERTQAFGTLSRASECKRERERERDAGRSKTENAKGDLSKGDLSGEFGI